MRTTHRSSLANRRPGRSSTPPRVAVDEAYKSAWDEALKKESACYEGLLVVELPALPTLVALVVRPTPSSSSCRKAGRRARRAGAGVVRSVD